MTAGDDQRTRATSSRRLQRAGASVLALAARFLQLRFVVPIGIGGWLAAEGIERGRIHELDWWQGVRGAGLDFTVVPAQQWSKRTLIDTNRTRWGGIVIEDRRARAEAATTWRFFYSGDTGYPRDFADIGQRFPGGCDWAALPIGAYEPRWFMRAMHVSPDEVMAILRDIGARQALAVHWGTFVLSDQPPRDLAAALARVGIAPGVFHVFRLGETRRMCALRTRA